MIREKGGSELPDHAKLKQNKEGKYRLRMVTIKDMAEILGISTTTVSNVIHGKTNQVSQKTVERVEKLLEEYEYVPNISARNLANNSSGIIGMAIKGRKDRCDNLIANSFFWKSGERD